MTIYQANLISKSKKYALIISRFNEFITKKLCEGCVVALSMHGVKEEEIDIIWTPGALEIPGVAALIAGSKKYDAVICLGAVIRGNTSHYDIVANESAKGIAQIALKTGVPVVNGIITTENIEQAVERAGTKSGNKGADAAVTAIELVNLYAEINRK